MAPMPPKLDREKVESALPCQIRGHLHDIFATWDIRVPERWPDHPRVREYLTLTAVQTLRNRKLRQATSRTAALREACEELGLPYETTRRRLSRTRKTYLDANATVGTNCPKTADFGP